jgi:cytochrome c oxidase subunit II
MSTSASSGSIFSAASPEAGAIAHLFIISLVICAVIFAVVAGLAMYGLIKFRWREGSPDPKQIRGNQTVEIVWTVVPLGIVILLFVLSLRAMNVSDPPLKGKPDLVVIGHQWWWEVRYPKLGIVTANEIHIPVGVPISVKLDSADVLHEFWVPELTRKMTTVPMLGNHIWIQADHPGTYEGVCSEFCGAEHAWMRFQVIAESPARYAAWVKDQTRPPPPATGEAALGRKVFTALTCASCHRIEGTSAGQAGPDLTHLESRAYIGGRVLANTPENLVRWLVDPQAIKPGVKMPTFHYSGRQLDELTAYLETLK